MALRFLGDAVAIGDRCGGVCGCAGCSADRCGVVWGCSAVISLSLLPRARCERSRCLGSAFIRQDVSLLGYVCGLTPSTGGATGDASPALRQHRFFASRKSRLKVLIRATTARHSSALAAPESCATAALVSAACALAANSVPPQRAVQSRRSSPEVRSRIVNSAGLCADAKTKKKQLVAKAGC